MNTPRPIRQKEIWRHKVNLLIATDDAKATAIARAIGVDDSAMSKMRGGKQRVFRPEHLGAIAELYGIDLAWFMDGRLDTQPPLPGVAARDPREEQVLVIARSLGYDAAIDRLLGKSVVQEIRSSEVRPPSPGPSAADTPPPRRVGGGGRGA